MSILFGHPTGNPNSFNAAIAHLQAGILDSVCISWMPSRATIDLLSRVQPLRSVAQRFGRRECPPLANVRKVQGRSREFCRLLMRIAGRDGRHVYDGANKWLMRTLVRESYRPTVTAVHSYEDCSLWPFIRAKKLNKACIYDLPICYHRAWERTRSELWRQYADWLPNNALVAEESWCIDQKTKEIELADITLVPSGYVEDTIREWHPYKQIARAPYGVDADFWAPQANERSAGPMRFIYAGHISVRKGVPLLIEAWSKAGLRDAELALVGSWQLADSKRGSLPAGVRWYSACSPQELREHYRRSDLFVFPSFCEGLALVLAEALACGLPAIASQASGGPEIITHACGRIFPTGNVDDLVDLLRWADKNRNSLSEMGRAARAQAEQLTWSNYRRAVTNAVSKII